MVHPWDEFRAMNAFAKPFAGISTGVIAASATAAPRLTGVKAYGFIDLEGAKVSAIIVEYDREITADGVTPAAFEISDYAIRQDRQFGGEAFESSAVPGREGGIAKVYRLRGPFRWLYSQRRDAEMRRGKLEGLKQPWLGRDAKGKIREGSGTSGLNSAQFTPHGPDPVFTESWRPTASSGFVPRKIARATPEQEIEP